MSQYVRRVGTVFFVSSIICVVASAIGYPVIKKLNISDVVFKQYITDVEESYKEAARIAQDGQVSVFCNFYCYRATAEDTVITLAARCNIPYETLATLNRISSASVNLANRNLLLPTASGIFLHELPENNSIEKLTIATVSSADMASAISVTLRNTKSAEKIIFIPGKRYSATERAFFLNAAFRFPLPDGVLTSEFGMRKNPVTGNRRFHKGIDLAAPIGTPIYAVRKGVVTTIGNNAIFGNYVIITHDNNWQSFYAHMQTVKKNCLNREVESGYSIGTVGNTGQSTGSHLHFELRELGTVRNPEDFLLR